MTFILVGMQHRAMRLRSSRQAGVRAGARYKFMEEPLVMDLVKFRGPVEGPVLILGKIGWGA